MKETLLLQNPSKPHPGSYFTRCEKKTKNTVAFAYAMLQAFIFFLIEENLFPFVSPCISYLVSGYLEPHLISKLNTVFHTILKKYNAALTIKTNEHIFII